VLSDSEYDVLARSGCFVCRILEGRPMMPDPEVVYEDAAHIAFLNQRTPQEAYTLVCPKRHVERFEDMPVAEWLALQGVVHRVAGAVAATTGALRVYLASLGSPERNPHLHVHVCPCPPGTPFERQQFVTMNPPDGRMLEVTPQRMRELGDQLREHLGRA
jgi:diadenosine tetraphosphate (Ap4A) HIT family hydrolase